MYDIACSLLKYLQVGSPEIIFQCYSLMVYIIHFSVMGKKGNAGKDTPFPPYFSFLWAQGIMSDIICLHNAQKVLTKPLMLCMMFGPMRCSGIGLSDGVTMERISDDLDE